MDYYPNIFFSPMFRLLRQMVGGGCSAVMTS
jgi:hypothetical protein